MSVSQVRNKNKSWINKTTRDLMTARDKAREVARTTQLDNDWNRFRSLRNKCTAETKKDKNMHFNKMYEDIIGKQDIRKLFNKTKIQLGWKSSGPPDMLCVDGKAVTAPGDIAQIQMDYFSNKVRKLIEKLPVTRGDPSAILKEALNAWTGKDERTVFKLRKINRMEMIKLIGELSNSKAFGNDGLDSLAIKLAATSIHVPLLHIVNLSIVNGDFANRWKLGRLIPLYKGKDCRKDSPSSYRPISLLPSTSKLVERAVQHQLTEFMENSGQINENNHAYRKAHGNINRNTPDYR